MRIIVARSAGFCMGVRRAVDLALDESVKDGEKLFTLGPLIHNTQVVEMLRERGVTTLANESMPQQRSRVLVRAHGVAPRTEEEFASRGHTIVDGTCPKVKTVHKVISKYRRQGYDIVIAGDEGHAEVVGLMGYAGERGHLIQSAEDVAQLGDLDKVCLVSQTTYDREMFNQIAEAVRERYGPDKAVVKRTICSATNRRQEEVRRLAHEVDYVIVVGGKNSANTQRLAKIARECGTLTQHVETEKDIDWPPLSSCETVAVTAGASTPNWMIKRTLDYLHFMSQAKKKSVRTVLWKLFDACAHLNIFVATGAATLYYAACYLQGYTFEALGALLAFLYFLSMYLWNSLASIEMTEHHGISRYRFYSAHKTGLFSLVGTGIVAILVLSFVQSRLLFYLMVFSTLAGTLYHTTIVPSPLRGLIKYRNLKDIPTSRDLFVALAWGTVLTFMPHAIADRFTISFATVLCFLWIFFLAYLRALILDLRDIEGDRIMGRETLVTIIGENKARRLALTLIQLLLVVSVLYSGITVVAQQSVGRKGLAFIFQIPVLLYVYLFAKWGRKISFRRSSLFSLLADTQFYLSGLLARIAAAVYS